MDPVVCRRGQDDGSDWFTMANAQTGRVEVAKKLDFEQLAYSNRTTLWLNVTVTVRALLLPTSLFHCSVRVQELCESGGDRPELPVLMSLTVSVDVKQH